MTKASLAQNAAEKKTTVTRALSALLRWWDAERRELPWRAKPGRTPDPYRVWLSEILLQQTTVAAVTPYYQRFLARWPDVGSLAQAEIGDVIDEFAGLGYYTRARSLHACARAVHAAGGAFPEDAAALLALPGIGAYTANAVAAIAFNQRRLPIDGNIRRVLSRFHGLARPDAEDKAAFAAAAALWADNARPGDLAQALMDLGATICRPRSPLCEACPLRTSCVARGLNPEDFPQRSPKKARKVRHGAAFYASDPHGNFLVRRRAHRGLLSGTLELPGTLEIERHESYDFRDSQPFPAKWRELPDTVEQAFTHFLLRLRVYRADVRAFPEEAGRAGLFALPGAEIDKLSSVMAKAATYARDG